MKSMGNPSSNRGFTLLEIMVTIAVLAIVLVSIFDLHSQTISMNIDAKFYATAPFLAKEKLAELELADFEDTADSSGDFGDDYPGFTWKRVMDTIQPDVLTTSGIRFRKITVHIGFDEDKRVYDLETYRYFYENE